MSSMRETINISALRQRQQMHRRQVRYFAIAWTGITLLLGAATFVAVYAATGALAAELPVSSGSILPPPVSENAAVVAQITATPFPTFPPPEQTQPTPEPPPPIIVVATPAVQPTVPPIRDLDFDLGIAVQKNPDPSVYALWVDMVRNQLRLNWVKSQLVWRDTERVKGQIDWSDLDASLTLLNEAGVKVLLSITKAPDWARDPGARIVADVHDGPPANPQDFADFLSALLRRYPGKIHAIEVWNEVNIDREWTTNPPAIDARRYVQLLQVAYNTIKSIDPNIIVISAGLAPTGANIPGAVTDDFIYMDQLIAAGMLNFVDCVGAHHNGLNVPPNQDWNNLPERNPPARFRGPWANPHHSWSFKSTLEGYANRIRAAGSDKKLCVTEFGWPSVEDLQGRGQLRDGFGFAADNTLQDQANFTVQAIELMQQWGFVRLAMLWNLNYGAQAGWNIGGAVGDNVPWSILGPNFQPRPVWQRIVDMDFRSRPRRAQ